MGGRARAGRVQGARQGESWEEPPPHGARVEREGRGWRLALTSCTGLLSASLKVASVDVELITISVSRSKR